MKKDYQRAFIKFPLLDLSNPVLFNRQDYQKQNEPGTSDQSLVRLQKQVRKIILLLIYYLTQVWWCNTKWFLSCSKKIHLLIYASQLITSELIPLSSVLLNLEMERNWKKNWISRDWKELFRSNKKHFL